MQRFALRVPFTTNVGEEGVFETKTSPAELPAASTHAASIVNEIMP